MAEEQAPASQPVPGRDVFISYASQDKAVADSVCQALERAGVTCWIAPRDVVPGESFAGAIVHAIDATKVIALILSEHAVTSQHVLREVERASSKRHPLIAFRIDLAPMPADFEYFLNTSQWLDASTGGVKRALPKLVESTRSALALSSSTAHIIASPAAAAGMTRRPTRALTALAAVVVAALGYFMVDKVWLSKRATVEHVAGESKETPTVAAIPDKSIAVLPFENRSARQDDAYFTDGIHDDILTQLTKIGAMKVVARTSVEQFRNTRLTTKVIGQMLGVARVLEGGVQRAGDRVHVTVQLIDAATDAHLWAESYDRKLTAANIFSIQSEIAAAIASALNATLTATEQTRLNTIPTQNLDAWEAYQLGRQHTANRTSAGLAEAEKFFQRAIALDPKFALAYVGLADTLVLKVAYSGALWAATLTKAEQAVNTALRLDAKLAEAWATSASIADLRQQDDRAESMYRRAIALNPNYAVAYQWMSSMLTSMGRADEALSLAQRAVELDPLSAIVNSNLAWCLEATGRFGEAEARYRKVIEIDPSMALSYEDLGELRGYALNRFADAVPFLEKAIAIDPGNPNPQFFLAVLYLDLDEVRAARMIKAAQDRWPDSADVLALSAILHLYQGDQEAALQDARRVLASAPGDPNGLRILRDADAKKSEDAVARARYAKAYPEFFTTEPPKVTRSNWFSAIDLVPILKKTGANERANILLDRTEQFIRTIPRMGLRGYGIADVEVYALRGQKREALAALHAAEKAGWRNGWRYARDIEPNLTSIRNEPEFKAVFADIERDMARQRAELNARRRNAPLDFTTPAH